MITQKKVQSALQKARNKWLKSPEGRDCLERTIINAGQEQYLRNRIEKAFLAGSAWGSEAHHAHTFRLLQEKARRALCGPGFVSDPPTIEDLVESLTDLACNRLNRIRELEDMISSLCKLGSRT